MSIFNELFGINKDDMIANCIMCSFEGTWYEGQEHEADDHPVVYNHCDDDVDTGCNCN